MHFPCINNKFVRGKMLLGGGGINAQNTGYVLCYIVGLRTIYIIIVVVTMITRRREANEIRCRHRHFPGDTMNVRLVLYYIL